MIDVHLIGYTADLAHLVLDVDPDGTGHHRLVVDADLFATVDQLREERRTVGLAVGDPTEYLDADDGEQSRAADAPATTGIRAAEVARAEPSGPTDPAVAGIGEPPVQPLLSPAEIQARLRAGRSPRSVAREAGTDLERIERWLPPILAERHRVLGRAHELRLSRPRLGRSRDTLATAVVRNLRARGVDGETLTWEVGRRRDGRWKVSARFLQRGRTRTATWTYDPTADELRAASELARELGFTRARRSGGGAGTSGPAEATPGTADGPASAAPPASPA